MAEPKSRREKLEMVHLAGLKYEAPVSVSALSFSFKKALLAFILCKKQNTKI